MHGIVRRKDVKYNVSDKVPGSHGQIQEYFSGRDKGNSWELRRVAVHYRERKNLNIVMTQISRLVCNG